jgi:hypothetical protein
MNSSKASPAVPALEKQKNQNRFLTVYLPYIVGLAVFFIVALAYCKPLMEGKVLFQSDIKSWQGMAQESLSYTDKTGNPTFWTNSMFGGMPNYQIGSRGMKIDRIGVDFQSLVHLFLNHDSPLFFLLGYFIGFLIMLRAFGVNRWLSIIGSLAIAFSSYFFIIISAGHNSKAECLGELAPIIGGFYLIFRNRKYLLGAALVMVYSSLAYVKHPQMAYYVLMMLGICGIAEIVAHIRSKEIGKLCISLLVFVGATAIGLAVRYPSIKSSREYMKETMRGGHSDLASTNDASSVHNTSGLSFEYATQWSYGIDETMTLLIPNFMGGSSGYNVGENSKPYKALIANGIPSAQAKEAITQMPEYRGEQPFTSGPVYVGAIVCFLFLLGCLIVPGPYKWALLISTVLSIMLSWGYHFKWLSELFYNYFPFYDKFRTVSSILVVAEIAMPLLGFLAIKEIMDGKVSKEKTLKSIYWAAGITAGIALFVALFGKAITNFSSATDAQYASYYPKWLIDSIVEQRKTMMTADAWRSFGFVAAAAVVLWLYVKDSKKFKFGYFAACLGALVLLDMWPVDKRYFNDSDFISPTQDKNYFAEQPYETIILKDTDPYFRVLNTTTNTFNESRTSYRLKSIGGYHAAKLRRYQDIIDKYLSKGDMNVIDMLNAKYLILQAPDKSGGLPMQNPDAMGNCWFVDNVRLVDTPDAECDSIGTIDLHTTAVADKQFAKYVTNPSTAHDSTATIALTKYAPDALDYHSSSNIDKTAIFSDIYYPYGWKAYIDGKPADIFRANYILRALNVPAGSHDIRFEFRPDSIYKGSYVALAFRIVMALFVIFVIVWYILQAFKKPEGGSPAQPATATAKK